MLPEIDEGEELFVRTDFSDDDAWYEVCDDIEASEFDLDIQFIDRPAYRNMEPDAIRKLVPAGFEGSAVFVVNAATMASEERPLLVIGLRDMAGKQFRATVACLHLVSGLLKRGNKGFVEFMAACDDDGVFRDESKLEIYD